MNYEKGTDVNSSKSYNKENIVIYKIFSINIAFI